MFSIGLNDNDLIKFVTSQIVFSFIKDLVDSIVMPVFGMLLSLLHIDNIYIPLGDHTINLSHIVKRLFYAGSVISVMYYFFIGK